MKEQYLKNAEKFVEQVVVEEQLFGLFNEQEGWANCYPHDNDDAKAVYLFWSDPKLAKKLQNAEWEKYQVEPISLATFIESWLDGMQKEHVFAGVNWDENLYGLEVEAMVLKNALIEKHAEVDKAQQEKDDNEIVH